MRLLKILFILLLIAFPFGELLRFDLGNNIRFKVLDVITGLMAISWLFLIATKKIKKPKIHWAFITFPVIALMSLLVNSIWLNPQEMFVASFYLIRWVSYIGVFFAMFSIEKSFIKSILPFLIIDGLIIVLLGFIQFTFFSSLKPLYYLGWDDHMYRLFSVFLDPNFTGGFLVLYLFFVSGMLYTYITDHKKNSSNLLQLRFLKSSRKSSIILLSSISLLTLLAVFLTFSRSSLLMMITGAVVFFILIGKKKLILLLFGIMLLFTLIISPKFYVENMNLFRQASVDARIGNYQVASSIVQEHPILGVGFNAYRYAKDRYDIQMGWVNAPSHADAGVDNSLLFVLATTGILGLSAYIYLWGYILRRTFLRYKKDKNIFAIIVLSSTSGLFVHALFINSLFFPAIMVWMWIQLGLMEQT